MPVFVWEFVRPGLWDLPEPDWWGFDPARAIVMGPDWSMADIAVQIGLWGSKSLARKNNWAGGIPIGISQFTRIGKMNKVVWIHNPPPEFLFDPDWGRCIVLGTTPP